MRGLGLLSFALLVSARSTAQHSVGTSKLRIQDAQRRPLIVSTGAAAEQRPASGPKFPRRPGHRPTGFIALGDSYSAGIGTGFNGSEDACRQGTHAHPELVHRDLVKQEGIDATTYQFLSCTGAGIADLLLDSDQSQIDAFNTTDTADFALLSIGGNDLGFFNIMNSCIFRFYSFVSGTCEEALRKAEEQLASTAFEVRLGLAITEILDRVHWEKRPWFTVTVTGYAQFFNAETDLCDDSSFGIWWRGPKLKRELRQKMNDMVRSVNDKIRRSVDAVNKGFEQNKILFVDYDAAFEGHRFCEPDVVEPDYTRNETWFFLVGGPDNGGNMTPQLPHHGTDQSAMWDSPQMMAFDACMQAAQEATYELRFAECMGRLHPLMQKGYEDLARTADMWLVPTFYGQTFHPVSSLSDQASGVDKVLISS